MPPTTSHEARDVMRDSETQRLIGELSAATKQVADSMKAVLSEQRAADRLLAEMRTTLDRVDKSLSQVRSVVLDGNGDSMTTRLKILENDYKQLLVRQAQADTSTKDKFDKLQDAVGENRDDKLRFTGGWKTVAIISAILVQLATLGLSLWAILK